MNTRCSYVKFCERPVRWYWGDYRYCTFHWHWTWMCGCKKHRRIRDV